MANNNEHARLVGKKPVWPWVLLILVLLLAGIATAAYYGGKKVDVSEETKNEAVETTKEAASNVADSVTDASKATIQNMREITSAVDVTSLRDRSVTLTDMTVKSVGTDDMVFWLNDSGAVDPSQNQGRDLLVYMSPQVQAQVHQTTTALKDGQKVKVSGTIKTLPTEDVIRSQWKLNAEDAAYVKNKLIYLDAQSVSLE